MKTDVDVLVLGAGPVGLTLANELLRRGASVRVAEKAPAIREISKALIWHVRTQEAFDRVGILERGLAEAKPLREVVMRAYGKRIGSWFFRGIDSAHPHAAIIGQNRTQHLLLDLLRERGGDVEYGTEAVALDASAVDSVAVTLRTNAGVEERVVARYVAGCEGSDSLVRKSLGLTFEGERYEGEQFVQADCKIAWTLPSGRSYLFLTDDGYMMVIEMPGDFVRIFISLPDRPGTDHGPPPNEQGAVEDMHAEPTLEEIRRNLVRLSGIEADLSEPVWLARYRTSHRYANTFRSGRCFLAGDAGHVHVPIGGQGMNTGVQDAFNLGWKLAGVVTGRYRSELLDTYDAERHPVAKALLKGTDRSYRGILHPSELQQRLVRMFGPFLVKSDLAQRAFATTLEELNIAYEHSPLNVDLGSEAGPAPGHRAPTGAAVVRGPDRTTLTLAAATRDAEWTLLLFGGLAANPDAAAGLATVGDLPPHLAPLCARFVVSTQTKPLEVPGYVTLVDAEELAHHAYGVTEPAFYLIRPDGVVALRGPGFNLGAVTRYFDETLGALADGAPLA